jgi:hypothetical protein
MKYRISQTFETLGEPCAKTFKSLSAAEAAAEKLRGEIANMVAGFATPDPDAYRSTTGYANEIAAWAHAEALADGATTYGHEAGEYIAEQAVEIEEIMTMPSLTREDFRRWGREGGLIARKTPRRKCSRCGSFVGQAGDCKRCQRLDADRRNYSNERRR